MNPNQHITCCNRLAKKASPSNIISRLESEPRDSLIHYPLPLSLLIFFFFLLLQKIAFALEAIASFPGVLYLHRKLFSR